MKNNIIFRKAIAFGTTSIYRIIVGVISFIVVTLLTHYDDNVFIGKIPLDIFITVFYGIAGMLPLIIFFEKNNHWVPLTLSIGFIGIFLAFAKNIHESNQTLLIPMIISSLGGAMFVSPIIFGKMFKIINDRHELNKLTNFNLINTGSVFSKERISLSGGFDGVPPVWEEYIDTCPKEYKKFLIAFKNKVKSDPNLFKKRAPEVRKSFPQMITVGNQTIEIHCHDKGWGDFMSAIVGEREEYRLYAF